MSKNIGVLNNGFHKLTVRVCDDIDDCSQKEIEFNLIIDSNQNKELNATIIEPTGNISLNSANFPVSVKIKVNDSNLLARTILYYLPDNGSPVQTASQLGASSDIIDLFWKDFPLPGNYKIYAEVTSWSGDKTKTNELIITVNAQENASSN
jgi:hypothetical protein